MRLQILVPVALAATALSPASAQDLARQEIVVTAQRIEQDDYSDYRPAVGLRREADFLVQQVAIRGDTRDEDLRDEEIRTMLANAVSRAGNVGVELAYGDYILTPLTPDNIEDVTLEQDTRPDSQRVSFLVKARLAGEQSG